MEACSFIGVVGKSGHRFRVGAAWYFRIRGLLSPEASGRVAPRSLNAPFLGANEDLEAKLRVEFRNPATYSREKRD